jgi:magnesium transporter
MDLKRGVLRLRRITGRQREVILRTSRGEFTLIPAALLPFYRDIYDHIMRVTDLAESYRDLLSGALDAYMSVVGNRMNEIMKVLTIFSAVMLPLTFIAGVYGMNFDILPELHMKYAYFAVWGVMLTVAVTMLGLFWRAGWIGSGGKKK